MGFWRDEEKIQHKIKLVNSITICSNIISDWFLVVLWLLSLQNPRPIIHEIRKYFLSSYCWRTCCTQHWFSWQHNHIYLCAGKDRGNLQEEVRDWIWLQCSAAVEEETEEPKHLWEVDHSFRHWWIWWENHKIYINKAMGLPLFFDDYKFITIL